MANPVLSRGFVVADDRPTYPQQGYAQQPGQSYVYGQEPPQSPYSTPWQPQPATPASLMTLDDVITKTMICIGLLVLVAAASWTFLPLHLAMVAGFVGGGGAFVTTLALGFRRKVGPVGAIAVALFEGLFVGAVSRVFEMYYPGIAFQAVLGTFVAAGVTLAAFKFGGFRLSGRMRRILLVAVVGMAVASLINFVLAMLGAGSPLVAGVVGEVGVLAWLFAGLGVVVAVFSLIDDFQMVEEGIAMGAPASESWRAAFGLTVTMVYLYINILRILSYLRR